VIKNLKPIVGRPGKSLAPLNLKELKDKLTEEHGPDITDEDVISAALYPAVLFMIMFNWRPNLNHL
jgi:pyruvate carboxylase